MTVAAFVHPFNVTQSVFVCRGTHLTPAMQVKLVTLAARDGFQVVLVGQCTPEVQRALGTPTPAFTPEAVRADVVAVPSAQHALAHVRSSYRNTFVLPAVGVVISLYDAVLARPGSPASAPAAAERPVIPDAPGRRVGRHAAS